MKNGFEDIAQGLPQHIKERQGTLIELISLKLLGDWQMNETEL